MGRFFECKKGCVECCKDPTVAVSISLDDMVRISEREVITITEFFDKALVARGIPQIADDDKLEVSEIRAYMRMPCPYIGEIEEGAQGCKIHCYKPLGCALAPEDRLAVGLESSRWDFGCLKPITKKRMKGVLKQVEKLDIEMEITRLLLYTPEIKIPPGFLGQNRVFRGLTSPYSTDAELIAAATIALDQAYRDELRQRIAQFEADIAKHGTIAAVLNSRYPENQFRKVYKA